MATPDPRCCGCTTLSPEPITLSWLHTLVKSVRRGRYPYRRVMDRKPSFSLITRWRVQRGLQRVTVGRRWRTPADVCRQGQPNLLSSLVAGLCWQRGVLVILTLLNTLMILAMSIRCLV